MKLILKFFKVAGAALAALLLLPAGLNAQTYPSKAITLVVPFAAGGGTDSIARDLARLLSDKLGQPVLVDNKGGGGGSIGANLVAKAPADGHTLLLATSTFATHAASEPGLPYNADQDFAAVALIGRGPLLVVSNKELGAKSITQLRALAQARPQGLDYCSAGKGSINHLAGELFRAKTQMNMTHIPYKGSGPAALELIAGRVNLFFATIPTIGAHVQANRVDLLAVTGSIRSPLYPDTPTMAEAGVPDFNVSTWWGVLAPAKTPKNVVDQLNRAINEIIAKDPVSSRLRNEGALAGSGSAADFEKVLASELALWRAAVKASGLKIQ